VARVVEVRACAVVRGQAAFATAALRSTSSLMVPMGSSSRQSQTRFMGEIVYASVVLVEFFFR